MREEKKGGERRGEEDENENEKREKIIELQKRRNLCSISVLL